MFILIISTDIYGNDGHLGDGGNSESVHDNNDGRMRYIHVHVDNGLPQHSSGNQEVAVQNYISL